MPVNNVAEKCPAKTNEYQEIVESKDSHFIEFNIVDDTGSPLSNIQLLIALPDGKTQKVISNELGVVRINGIASGNCQILSNWKSTSIDDVVLIL
jgi:16S rRNA U1498 N3-methylase RsmE